MKCSSCRFWDEAEDKGITEDQGICDTTKGYGSCSSTKLSAYDPHEKGAMDSLVYSDGEGYSVDCLVGPDFGCIHFMRLKL